MKLSEISFFPLFQHRTHPGYRAAGPDRGHEDIDLSVGRVPEFFGRGLRMDRRVGAVVELLWHERIRRRLWKPLLSLTSAHD